MTQQTLPLWEELPSLDLYLDQVLLYVNQTSSAISQKTDKPLTAAMVNNYVKHGLLSKPTKKKYTRAQVARLIVIQLLKPVFALPDIARCIDALGQEQEQAALYNAFVAYLADGETNCPAIIQTACQTLQLYHQTLELAHKLGGMTDEPDL